MGDLIAWTISKGWNHRKTHCYKGYQTSNIKLIKPWPSCLNSSHPHWRRPKLQRHEVITRSFGSSMLSIGIGANLHRKPMFFTIKYRGFRGFLWKKTHHPIQFGDVFQKGIRVWKLVFRLVAGPAISWYAASEPSVISTGSLPIINFLSTGNPGMPRNKKQLEPQTESQQKLNTLQVLDVLLAQRTNNNVVPRVYRNGFQVLPTWLVAQGLNLPLDMLLFAERFSRKPCSEPHESFRCLSARLNDDSK